MFAVVNILDLEGSYEKHMPQDIVGWFSAV